MEILYLLGNPIGFVWMAFTWHIWRGYQLASDEKHLIESKHKIFYAIFTTAYFGGYFYIRAIL